MEHLWDDLDEYFMEWGFLFDNKKKIEEEKKAMWNTLDEILALPVTYTCPIEERE